MIQEPFIPISFFFISSSESAPSTTLLQESVSPSMADNQGFAYSVGGHRGLKIGWVGR